MKRFLFVGLALVMTARVLAAQDEAVEGAAAEKVENTAKVFFRNADFWSKDWYQYLDGDPVPFAEVKAAISAVPENKTLLKQERGWRAVSYVCMGLLAASYGLYTAYDLGDFNGSEVVLPASVYTLCVSIFGSILSGQIANQKLQRAVDNYNYEISR